VSPDRTREGVPARHRAAHGYYERETRPCTTSEGTDSATDARASAVWTETVNADELHDVWDERVLHFVRTYVPHYLRGLQGLAASTRVAERCIERPLALGMLVEFDGTRYWLMNLRAQEAVRLAWPVRPEWLASRPPTTDGAVAEVAWYQQDSVGLPWCAP